MTGFLDIPPDDPRALRLAASLDDGGARDIVPLIRQVLLSSDVPEPSLTVPDGAGLREVAAAAGLEVQPVGSDRLRVSLGEAPGLGWLDGDVRAIDLAAAAPGDLTIGVAAPCTTQSRTGSPVPADPAFKRATGYSTHPVAAQQDAARAVALAAPGAVTHVVLPTGAGKSDVGLLPALLRQGQVVVVVPTIAIAMDQEASLLARLGPSLGLEAPLAW
jgi:hypothetical protein